MVLNYLLVLPLIVLLKIFLLFIGYIVLGVNCRGNIEVDRLYVHAHVLTILKIRNWIEHCHMDHTFTYHKYLTKKREEPMYAYHYTLVQIISDFFLVKDRFYTQRVRF